MSIVSNELLQEDDNHQCQDKLDSPITDFNHQVDIDEYLEGDLPLQNNKTLQNQSGGDSSADDSANQSSQDENKSLEDGNTNHSGKDQSDDSYSTSDSESDEAMSIRQRNNLKQERARFSRFIPDEAIENPELFGLRRSGRERKQRHDIFDEINSLENVHHRRQKQSTRNPKTTSGSSSKQTQQKSRSKHTLSRYDNDSNDSSEDDSDDDNWDPSSGSAHRSRSKHRFNKKLDTANENSSSDSPSNDSDSWFPSGQKSRNRKKLSRRNFPRKVDQLDAISPEGRYRQRISLRATQREINYCENDSEEDWDDQVASEQLSKQNVSQLHIDHSLKLLEFVPSAIFA